MIKISATIVTLNEESNLPRAIESLRCADEIVVVDSGSTDRTCEIAADLGARVIREPWRGYAAQKNFAAASGSHDWILSLDADEALDEVLEAEILAVKQTGAECVAFSSNRLTQYLGRWILHSGWYPDKKIRLYHRQSAQWFGEYVHESVRAQGPVGELQGNILHFTCHSIADHFKTLDRYTTLAAREIRAKQCPVPLRKLWVDPAWTFFRTYLLQRGFLDGPQGLTISWMAALYVYLKYAKARGLE